MKNIFIVVSTLVFFTQQLLCQVPLASPAMIFETPLSPRIANYQIEVLLDTEEKTLTGKQLLTWRNTSNKPAAELRFHLYLNGFRNLESTFMLGYSQRGRFLTRKDGWGFIDVTQVRRITNVKVDQPMLLAKAELAPNIDLTSRMAFIQPDIPEHINDKSVISIKLDEPLQPNKTIFLLMDFMAGLPDPAIERTGAKAEYFMVGQWFPKIGVFSNDGWYCHQFHANSEFFADFGVYDVAITIPNENLLGATGLETAVKQHENGTATHYYHAEDVHDFAWATSPEFREYRGKAQDVDIRVLIQPDHEDLAARHVEAAKIAVQYYQDWYGDYPYPNLTIIDPRRSARRTGGMEYPTLITTDSKYGLPDGVRTLEQVIIHEFGHNYFYHLLASNEAEESWLDEGITSYTEAQIMQAEYGPQGDWLDVLGLQINNVDYQRTQYLFFPDLDPTLQKSWQYYSEISYAINSYAKPATFLTTLQNYLGQDVMLRIMRAYVEQWRFRHPTTKDFVALASEVSKQDLSWFFDQAIYTNKVLDYAVDQIKSVPISTKTVENSPADSTGLATDQLYQNDIDLRRRGQFVFPVELQLVFANGDTLMEHWDGKSLWKKFRIVRNSKLVSAVIDPHNKVLLDINMTNNSKLVNPTSIGATKLSARWMFWTQFLFDQPEFLNLVTLIGG